MANVVVTMSGDEARLFKSLSKVIAQEQKMIDKFKEIGKESKKAGKEAEGAFGAQAANNLARYVVGLVSVSAAIQAANKLLEDQKRLAAEAAGEGFKLAQAQQEAIKNLTGLSTQEKAQALSQARPIVERTGFPDEARVVEAIGAGFSASSDLQKTLSAVEAASRLTRLKPDDLAAVSSGAIDLARASGITDARQNLAFALSAGSQARIEDPRKLMESMAPVVASGVERVPKQDRQEAAREIAAVFATFTRGATDKLGKSADTASTQFVSRLTQFFAGKEGAPETVFGQIEALQQDQRLREQFLATPFGEERFKGPIQQLLESGNQLAKDLQAAKAGITFDPQTYEQNVREISGLTPQLQVATRQAASEGLMQGEKLDPEMIRRGALQKIVDDTLDQMRSGPTDLIDNWMASMFGPAGWRLGTDKTPERQAINLLEQRMGKFDPNDPEGQKSRAAIQRQIDVIKELELEQAPRARSTIRDLIEPESREEKRIRQEQMRRMRDQAPLPEATRERAQGGAMNVRDELDKAMPTIRVQGSGGREDATAAQAAASMADAANSLKDVAQEMRRAAGMQIAAASAATRGPSVRTPARPTSRPNQMGERNAHRE